MKDLAQILYEESQVIAQFTDQLAAEQEALKEGKTDTLMLFAEEKAKLAGHLESLAAERNLWLKAHNYPADQHGMQRWCQENPKETTALAQWAKTLSMATKAKELNRLNGELITIHLKHNAQALQILKRSEHSLGLYGPDGKSSAEGQHINITDLA